jgi:hypothetical protein
MELEDKERTCALLDIWIRRHRVGKSMCTVIDLNTEVEKGKSMCTARDLDTEVYDR